MYSIVRDLLCLIVMGISPSRMQFTSVGFISSQPYLKSMANSHKVHFLFWRTKKWWFFCMLQLDRRTISVAIRFLKAKTPEQRAAVDLDTHYTKVNNQVQTRNLVSLENLYIGCYCYIKKIERAISSFKPGVPLERSNGMYEDNLEIDSVLFTLW